MKNGFVMPRRVEFMDTDMAGIAHFTAYFRYMETAEHELFRALGLAAATKDSERHLGWPRVSCGFDFKAALRFQDPFEVHLGITRMGKRSISYHTDIVRDEQIIASGHTTSVCCTIDTAGGMASIDIPEDVTHKLKPYLIPEKKRSKSHD
ncbi:MAG: acyl-CoA thioesterase [Phycisphaeraceae bacterium]|nr:acyl-CoA thioesterase [Phycisphaeraceae bacterium]